MKIEKLRNIEMIISNSYDDPDSGGRPIHYLYEDIREYNPSLTNDEVMETFVSFVEFLLKNQIVKLAGIYDYENDKEVSWKGSNEEVIELLKEWIRIYPRKKLEKDPQYFFEFKYCFLDWQIPWSIDLEKYGIKSV